jgi:hypothetical protein
MVADRLSILRVLIISGSTSDGEASNLLSMKRGLARVVIFTLLEKDNYAVCSVVILENGAWS